MKKQSSVIIAQRLVNLYRQAHVIIGGWEVVNKTFVEEADADVLAELEKIPTGSALAQHIRNLQSGKTKPNSIDRNLLPYGGAFAEAITEIKFSSKELEELAAVLKDFQPDSEHLDKVRDLPAVKKFGEKWLPAVRMALTGYPDLQQKWRMVKQTERAYNLWGQANQVLIAPATERVRAQIQADLPEYETYLPLFGDAGNDLLVKLRRFVNVMQ